MGEKKTKSLKFTERYGVKLASVYEGNTDKLKIPPPGHPLHDPSSRTTFDPIKVKEIDEGGDANANTAIEVFSDPDTSTLWIVDGRGTFLDIAEVNRVRTAEERELISPRITRFVGDEQAAARRIHVKNYHRRTPTDSAMALAIVAMRARGIGWAECASALHVETDAPEQWCRKRMMLGYCSADVRQAVDKGEFPLSIARKFAGGKIDGSEALGQKAQADLLADMRKTRERGKDDKPKAVAPKARGRVVEALSNGKTEGLLATDAIVARFAAAVLRRLDGDEHAFEGPFKAHAKVVKIIEEALKVPKKLVEAEAAE